ncbi:MAG TPA: transglutaminase domain-containing protein [Drouetiella sp.]|jgi:Transglutaminase-like superfamily
MFGSIISFMLRAVLAVLFYATPILGFWVASSLAAYLGGPAWVAWAVGALLFPLIPGIWEFNAWAYRDPNKKAWFTPLDRLSLKTFAVGLTFIVALLYFYPQTAFVALSTRGDWMLDGKKDGRANEIRRDLFAAANGLEWLYRYSKKNPYRDYIDSAARKQAEKATEQLANQTRKEQASSKSNGASDQVDKTAIADRFGHASDSGEKSTDDNGHDDSRQSDQDTMASTSDDDGNQTNGHDELSENHATQINNRYEINNKNKWPWKDPHIHPAVANMPASVETSIKSVAKYLAAQEKDPALRIKALHDYVADRIAYDTVAFFSNTYPSQDAEDVFRKRKGVCAGYANLLSALAAACGEKIIVVLGNARDPNSSDKLAGGGHAWNAARVNGNWYLIDACWDAGYVSREQGFTRAYKTAYLMPPPAVMLVDHFPEETTWQLLAHPLTQGDFLRQPVLTPGFVADNLKLVSPTRAQNETGGAATVVVNNPDNVWLMTGLEQNGRQLANQRQVTNDKLSQLVSQLPGKGTYRMNIFANKTSEYGQYEMVGSVDFVNR